MDPEDAGGGDPLRGPGLNGRVFVPGREASLKIMENKRIIILGILLFFIICIILMTLWMAGMLF